MSPFSLRLFVLVSALARRLLIRVQNFLVFLFMVSLKFINQIWPHIQNLRYCILLLDIDQSNLSILDYENRAS